MCSLLSGAVLRSTYVNTATAAAAAAAAAAAVCQYWYSCDQRRYADRPSDCATDGIRATATTTLYVQQQQHSSSDSIEQQYRAHRATGGEKIGDFHEVSHFFCNYFSQISNFRRKHKNWEEMEGGDGGWGRYPHRKKILIHFSRLESAGRYTPVHSLVGSEGRAVTA